jgi:heat shock protein HslJ
MRFACVICVLASYFVGGCGERSVTKELEDRHFVLDSADGFEPVAGTMVHLVFDGSQVSISGGCNGQAGEFEVRSGRLVVGGLSSTLIVCVPALSEQDDWLATFLTSRPRLELRGAELTLIGADATLTFLDREQADPDRPLTGRLWSVDSFIEGDAVSRGPLTAAPSVQFEENGQVRVDTTCNTGGGQYSVRGDRLTLTGMAYTEEGCAAASLEAKVQAVLRDGTLSFEIEASRLTLMHGNVGLSARAP